MKTHLTSLTVHFEPSGKRCVIVYRADDQHENWHRIYHKITKSSLNRIEDIYRHAAWSFYVASDGTVLVSPQY